MAIIKIGPPLAGIRGTIGGITYSENGSSPYAKLWARAPNPRTPKQTTERGYLSRMPALWNALTDGQRDDWRSFAADPAQELTSSLGEAYYASGYNWFCKCNVRLTRVGRATIEDIPAIVRPAAPTIDDFRVCEAGSESDLCTCGTATASSEYVGFEAPHAFDDDLADPNYWKTDTGVITGWLQYEFCDPVNPKEYRIYIKVFDAAYNPKDWTLEVWTGGAWEILHTVTDFAPAAAGWHAFYMPNQYTETTYRINITANNGSATALRIWEMEYYAAAVGKSVICYPEDSFSAPSYPDLVLFISMGNSIGMDVQYPGYYEILAQQTAGRWFATFQTELESVFGTILPNRSWFCFLHRQTPEGIRSDGQAARAVT